MGKRCFRKFHTVRNKIFGLNSVNPSLLNKNKFKWVLFKYHIFIDYKCNNLQHDQKENGEQWVLYAPMCLNIHIKKKMFMYLDIYRIFLEGYTGVINIGASWERDWGLGLENDIFYYIFFFCLNFFNLCKYQIFH